jgi:PST family polysaccharide transporter
MHLKLINLSWLTTEQMIRLLIGLFVMTFVARHLGPDQFGLYAYIFALAGMLLPFAKFGLDVLIMRAVADDPGSTSQIVRRTALFRTGIAVLAALLLLASVALPITPAGVTPTLAGLAALVLLSTPLDTSFSVVKALEKVKRVVLLRISVAVAAAAVTIWLVWKGAGLESFVAVRGVEAVFLAVAAWIGLAMLHQRRGPPEAATFKITAGAPLMLAGLGTVIYMRIDQVMLGPMSSTRELGQYGVAVRIVEALNFITFAIQSTFYASLVRSFRRSRDEFDTCIQRIFDIQSVAAWAAMVVVGLLGVLLLVPVFGPEFRGALPMLAILLLGMPFLFLNQAWSGMLTVRGWLWTAPAATAVGAAVNVLLNLMLIPALGGRGAAIATVASYLVTGIGVSAVVPRLRPSARAMIKALSPVAACRRTYQLYIAQPKR